MTYPVITLQESAFINIFCAMNLLRQHQIRHIPLLNEQEQIVGLLTHESLMENYAIELERQVEQRTAALEAMAERAQLVTRIASQIWSSLHLPEILETTVQELQSLLNCDSVAIWQFQSHDRFSVVAEATANDDSFRLSQQVHNPCFVPDWVAPYRNGQIRVVSDIDTTEMSDDHQALMRGLQIRAKILMPLVHEETLWGMLSVIESHAPRRGRPKR